MGAGAKASGRVRAGKLARVTLGTGDLDARGPRPAETQAA